MNFPKVFPLKALSMRWHVLAAMAITGSAWATTQCRGPPPEYVHVEKSPVFMLGGWIVLGLFLLAGIALMYLAVRSTRNWRWLKRLPILLLGIVMMLGVWLCGLGMFVGAFVFAC